MIASGLEALVPYLLAALGALAAERAGILNIAMEGYMLAGAFVSVVVSKITGSPVLGILSALGMGMIWAQIQVWGTLKLKSDPFITGLALNLLIPALIGVAAQAWTGTEGQIRLDFAGSGTFNIPGVDRVPILSEILCGHGLFFWGTVALVPVASLILNRTPWGMALRAAGSQPGILLLTGRSPQTYQRLGLTISGALGSLGGAVLALNLGAFIQGVSGGRGWIALVILYLGFRSPWGLAIASGVFAAAEVGAQYLQGLPQIPQRLVLALPYLFTLIAYVGYSWWRNRKAVK